MLMCEVDKPLSYDAFTKAVICAENEEIGIYKPDSGIELAFPSHRLAANLWSAYDENN
jgi:hypothetical protein